MDWSIVFCVLSLLGVGMLVVYSASQVPALPGRSDVFARQFMWMGMGLAVMLVCTVIPFRFWEEYSHFLYGFSLLLLLAVPLFGVERLGATRWLMIGGLQFQPSEMAKIATLLFVSRLLAKPRIDLTRLGTLIPIAVAAGLPFVLILLEPDLGTSLSIPAAVVPMIYWAGLPLVVIFTLFSPLLSAILSINIWIWLLFLGVVGIILVLLHARRHMVIAVLAVNILVGTITPALWNSLKPYQR